MKVASELSSAFFPHGLCATIGNFDGVHAGHRALIEYTRFEAARRGLDFALVTFWPHPRHVIHASHMPLTNRDSRRALLSACGVPLLVELPFTREFAALTAREFIEGWLKKAGLRHLVVGHDFVMGHNREGNFEALAQLGRENGFGLSRLPAVQVNGQAVSSSHLRKLLREGKVADAAAMLGHFYSVTGIIEAGAARGRSLGFPTANLGSIETLLPGDGVYVCLAHIDGQRFAAVTNIGNNPTFNGSRKTVESFLLDAQGDFYGKSMTLEFVARLRGETKFDSPETLVAQIERDVEQTRAIAARLER